MPAVRIELAAYLVGYMFVGFQPTIAEATGSMEPLPWWGQLGVCGMIGFLHWWTIGRTIPQLAATQERGMNSMADEIKGMRDDLNTSSERQLTLLGELVKKS